MSVSAYKLIERIVAKTVEHKKPEMKRRLKKMYKQGKIEKKAMAKYIKAEGL